MSTLKRFFKDTIIYGIAAVLPRVINFLLVRVHTDALPTNNYAENTNFYIWIALFTVLLTFGMETAFFRFYKAEEKKDTIIATSFISVFIASIIFLISAFIFSNEFINLYFKYLFKCFFNVFIIFNKYKINFLIIKILYYLQLLILLFVVTTLAYGSSFLLVPFVDQYLSDGLGLNVLPVFSFVNFIKIFLIGLLVLIIFSIPTINSIDQVKASNLFRNVFQNLEFYYSKKSVILSFLLLSILVLVFSYNSENPMYSIGYFGAFFVCLGVFFLLSKLIIFFLKKFKSTPNISLKVSIKNITQTKSITPITIMSLGLGVTLLLTLALVGTNFKREIAKSIPNIAPDYFFVGIQKGEKEKFETNIFKMDPNAKVEIVPMVSSGIVKINGINPNTYISSDNDSYWVIGSDRRSSWVNEVPEDNPITEGKWWDLTKSNELQISLDAKVAQDLKINLGNSKVKRVIFNGIELEYGENKILITKSNFNTYFRTNRFVQMDSLEFSLYTSKVDGKHTPELIARKKLIDFLKK